MSIKRILNDVKNELQLNQKQIILEKENIDLLEHILVRETKKLCQRENLDSINKDLKRYSKEELEVMLFDAKKFVDNLLSIECSTPGIGHFSIRDNSLISKIVLMSYIFTGTNIAIAGIGAFIEPKVSLALALPTALIGLWSYTSYQIAKSSGYSTFYNKIVIEPASQLSVNGTIAHEYAHHIFFEHRIFCHKIEEGFCRGVQRLYDEKLAEDMGDERYSHHSAWRSCIEINNAYRWACNKTSRKPAAFKELRGKKMGI